LPLKCYKIEESSPFFEICPYFDLNWSLKVFFFEVAWSWKPCVGFYFDLPRNNQIESLDSVGNHFIIYLAALVLLFVRKEMRYLFFILKMLNST